MKGKALIITEAKGKTVADYIGKSEFDYIVCPGGSLKPLKKGCYEINDRAYEDAKSGKYGMHEHNDATCLAYEISRESGKPAYMLYPMSCDELLAIKRITSNARVSKHSRYHALEHRIAMRKYAAETGNDAYDMNLIVIYIGDRVSVSAMQRGTCIDVNDCIGGEGPMGLTSSGDVPVAQLAAYYLESGKSLEEMTEILTKKSGIAEFGEFTDMSELDKACDSDADLKLACEAMAYQTAKWVGSSALALKGQVDGIVICGKAASSEVITDSLVKRIEKIAPVRVYKDLDIEAGMCELARLLGTNALPVDEY